MSRTYRGILVPADPTQPIIEWTATVPVVETGRNPESLLRQGICQAIHAEWLECVTSTHLHDLAPSRTHTVTMVVDEEGEMAHADKRINPRAWVFYPNARSAIYGDVILLGQRRDLEDGYTLESLPAHITAKTLAQKMLEIQP